jgi:hypothetical protein
MLLSDDPPDSSVSRRRSSRASGPPSWLGRGDGWMSSSASSWAGDGGGQRLDPDGRSTMALGSSVSPAVPSAAAGSPHPLSRGRKRKTWGSGDIVVGEGDENDENAARALHSVRQPLVSIQATKSATKRTRTPQRGRRRAGRRASVMEGESESLLSPSVEVGASILLSLAFAAAD